MANVSHTAGARFVTAALAVLLLGACGGTSTNTATPAAASSPTASAPSPSAATGVGTSVGVTEKEFSIMLSQTSFSPATDTFAIQNKGTFPHNLTIKVG